MSPMAKVRTPFTRGNIFISWSGDESRRIAEALCSWLPLIVESRRLWLSCQDITGGERWAAELARKLEASNFGILVVTPWNKDSPWLLFEAGALSKGMQTGRVVPYLVGIDPDEIKGPLAQFQALPCDQEGSYRLAKTINSTLERPLAEQVLRKRFEAFWPELHSSLQSVNSVIKEKAKTTEGKDHLQTRQENDLATLRRELSETTGMVRELVRVWNPAVGLANTKQLRESRRAPTSLVGNLGSTYRQQPHVRHTCTRQDSRSLLLRRKQPPYGQIL